MSLTGVEVPVEALDNVEPNTVLVVISDEQGRVKVVKIDPQSVVAGEAFLKVAAAENQPQAGCWVFYGGKWVWIDPCPN
ncbi:MAG: hypothetical protein H6973_10905 [Gammaproteobacteria bacterium]|nr:hypothetical protein [Gammaproteobacteria bacterium]